MAETAVSRNSYADEPALTDPRLPSHTLLIISPSSPRRFPTTTAIPLRLRLPFPLLQLNLVLQIPLPTLMRIRFRPRSYILLRRQPPTRLCLAAVGKSASLHLLRSWLGRHGRPAQQRVIRRRLGGSGPDALEGFRVDSAVS